MEVLVKYKLLQRFVKAKLGYGGLVFGSSQFLIRPHLPQKWQSISKWSKVTRK